MARRAVKPPAHFVVRMVLPSGVTKARAREYIADAVRSWNGGFHPDDPLFNLDRDRVRVSHLKQASGEA